jgi:hypothetical protein
MMEVDVESDGMMNGRWEGDGRRLERNKAGGWNRNPLNTHPRSRLKFSAVFEKLRAMTTNGAESTGALANRAVMESEKHGKKVEDEHSRDMANLANAVLKPSIPMPSSSTQIRGVDFNDYLTPHYKNAITVQQLTATFTRTGFQASNLGRAVEIINNMVHSREDAENSDDGSQLIFHRIRMMRIKNLLLLMQNAQSSSDTRQT